MAFSTESWASKRSFTLSHAAVSSIGSCCWETLLGNILPRRRRSRSRPVAKWTAPGSADRPARRLHQPVSSVWRGCGFGCNRSTSICTPAAAVPILPCLSLSDLRCHQTSPASQPTTSRPRAQQPPRRSWSRSGFASFAFPKAAETARSAPVRLSSIPALC